MTPTEILDLDRDKQLVTDYADVINAVNEVKYAVACLGRALSRPGMTAMHARAAVIKSPWGDRERMILDLLRSQLVRDVDAIARVTALHDEHSVDYNEVRHFLAELQLIDELNEARR